MDKGMMDKGMMDKGMMDKGMMDKGMKTQFPILQFLCPDSYVPIPMSRFRRADGYFSIR
jgi:hypothetical protein